MGIKRHAYTWTLQRRTMTLGPRSVVMGILNVTPDSFSDGGLYFDLQKAVDRAVEIQELGADILDIGAESSRPGSQAISEEEELERLLPVLRAILPKVQIPVSVDTYRSNVARAALAEGAEVVNDISGLRFDPRIAEVGAEFRAGMILMHSRGSRDELHLQAPMSDAVAEVGRGLTASAERALKAGIAKESIVLDPGIGFGKRAEESRTVLRNLGQLASLDYPLLLGTSRKSFIGKIVQPGPLTRLWGTAATVASSVLQGAHIVRVHDVQEMRAMVDVLDALLEP